MVHRITKILTRFSACYYVTKRIWSSICFSLKLGRNNICTVKINDQCTLKLRKNESDQEVFLTTFIDQYHRSHVYLGKAPVIFDLGCNIGLTMIDFKMEYPDATIVGVEMDKDNYDSCKKNIAGFTNCSIIQAAIWKENGIVDYEGENEQSYSIEKISSGTGGSVRAITMDDLIKETNTKHIDYIKMDIEGAEKDILLENVSRKWLQQVSYLSIEVHDTKDMDNKVLLLKLKTELESHGFFVYKGAKHWASLFAIKKSTFAEGM